MMLVVSTSMYHRVLEWLQEFTDTDKGAIPLKMLTNMLYTYLLQL